MLMQARRLPEAEHHFRRAVAADPGFAEAHYNLGRSLESRGDRAGAIASYKQALQLKPDLRSAADDLRRLTNGR
jgi:Flp pilus assembly protein TadD